MYTNIRTASSIKYNGRKTLKGCPRIKRENKRNKASLYLFMSWVRMQTLIS